MLNNNLNISLIGDIAFNGLLSYEPEKNKERFADISNVFSNSDIVFANLEFPIKVIDEKNEYKNIIYYSLPNPTKELLKILNIGCVSIANNHVYDCKMSGLKATIDILDELGIYHTGAGWKKEHIEPVIIEKNGLRLGFLAYIDKSTNPKTENFPELFINYFETENVIKDIKKLKKDIDKIIISIHWGADYSYYPTSKQVELAHKIVDAGADIIMGHHPHTIQPYELYKEKYIFYSLGGLTYGDFIWDGKLGALKRKTKKAAFPVIDENLNLIEFITSKELKGNYIKLTSWDYKRWSKIHLCITKLIVKYKIIKIAINFKEAFLDRIIEYFFGYYRNPFKQLFQITVNFKKIKYLKRDFKKLFKGN